MDEYRKLLTGYIRDKSISTDQQFKDGISATVKWLHGLFASRGFTVTVIEGYDNPVLVAHYEINPAFQTCLIYGHYDVQPADVADGWDSEPFTATERDGRFYCRGAIDNKGQNLIHIVSIFDLIKTGKLGYNIKFILEGNEETGSPKLPKLIADKKDLLKADFTLISDGELTAETPTIEIGFRGGFNLTLTVTTSNTDLHSGIYGGAAPNAAHELAKLIARFYDTDNHIAIEDFYEGVDEITPDIKVNNEKIPFNREEYERISGTRSLLLEPGYDYYTETGLRPTIQVTGVKTGYMGEGYRNGIPASATAKINFRLVIRQDPEKIVRLFSDYVRKQLPDYVDAKIEVSDPYNGIKLTIDNPFVKKAYQKLAAAYGKEPIYKYVGGGLPIVTLFNDILGIPNVLVPLANEDCKMHAANENYAVEYVQKALVFSKSFFSSER